MSNNAAREKRLDKAQLRVLMTCPFFAPGVAKLPVIWDSSIPTACTDGQRIRWNPDWFDILSNEVLVTVLCHEVLHPLLGHLWRMPAGGDWELFNQACDHAVNLMLKEFGQQVTNKRLADPFPFPEPQDSYCADRRFSGMSEEQVYNILNTENRARKPLDSPAGNRGAGGKSKQQGGSKAKQARVPFGEMEQPKVRGSSKGSPDKKLQTDWTATLVQSVEAAKGMGAVPGALQRLVDGITSPQVDWVDVLRSWLREQCSDDWDWLRPAMEYEGSGFILPSLRSEKMGPVVFATDTSGSIDGEMLTKFQAEKQNCLDELRPSRLVDICCDTKIQLVKDYSPGETVGKEAPGGGGTSFVPVFKHVEGMTEAPKCLVYLTDLDGKFPTEVPQYPVIFVTWTKDGKAPFGEVIYAGS